jgi:endonuclease G
MIPYFHSPLLAQEVSSRILTNENTIAFHQRQLDSLREATDSLKLVRIMQNLETIGWPGTGDKLIKHSAMALEYSEEHEMARWVSHMILKDVASGRTSRTNDFRADPEVSTGSAVEADYFLTFKDAEGKTNYDGFGFDRGHLAPSADFRWNQKALSESYFYSNMTPQRPEFNRDSWARIEEYIRSYAIDNEVDLYVVTGPVLTNDLAKIKRSINGLSIPDFHFKVAYDVENMKGIAFIMPNKLCEGPLEAYVTSIDEIEALTGLDVFPNLDPETSDKLESTIDYLPWLPKSQQNDVMMLDSEILGKNRFNTLQAYNFIDSGKKVEICGTVVSTFKSQNGHVFVNLDKRFPNTVFTVTIWSRDSSNFSYKPEEALQGKRVCVKGEVTSREGLPQTTANSEKQIVFLDDYH